MAKIQLKKRLKHKMDESMKHEKMSKDAMTDKGEYKKSKSKKKK